MTALPKHPPESWDELMGNLQSALGYLSEKHSEDYI